MKKIVVFTYGNSNDPTVWSNVPYLLTKELEKQNCELLRVNIETKQNFLTYFYSLLCKILIRKTTYYFVRSKINRIIVNRKIKKIVKKYDEWADFYISISYDFSPSPFTNKDVILVSDWPIEYAIEKRFKKNPDFLEMKDIKRHKYLLDNATYKISLFQDVATYMNKYYKGKTYYLGGLINAFESTDGYDKINNRNYITFIGKKSYIDSAQEIIKAFKLIDKKMILSKNIELHIIGMNKKDFPKVDNNRIIFHGYLNKGNDNQRKEYYNIIRHSLVIINTNDKWAGMSSILECMYYYRPIITSKYDEFVKTFGNKIDFGYYANNNYQDILNKINLLLKQSYKNYTKMAFNSHEKVKDFSYCNFVKKILEIQQKNKNDM